MPFTLKKDKKVEVSFTNWILGGSLVSLTSTTSTDPSRLRSGAKRVIVTEFESVFPSFTSFILNIYPI
jgi:hypothetical protein